MLRTPRDTKAIGITDQGLLSKVVKFVRSPTTHWSDLDKIEPIKREGQSRNLLKKLVERKRRNDFVRKREFDFLRKLRHRERLVTSENEDNPQSDSTSLAGPTEGVVEPECTLEKIDQIEAQMSQAWFDKQLPARYGQDAKTSRAQRRAKEPVGEHAKAAPVPQLTDLPISERIRHLHEQLDQNSATQGRLRRVEVRSFAHTEPMPAESLNRFNPIQEQGERNSLTSHQFRLSERSLSDLSSRMLADPIDPVVSDVRHIESAPFTRSAGSKEQPFNSQSHENRLGATQGATQRSFASILVEAEDSRTTDYQTRHVHIEKRSEFAATEVMSDDAFNAEFARLRQKRKLAPIEVEPVSTRDTGSTRFTKSVFDTGEIADLHVEVRALNKFDAVLEESAIRFANGDFTGAEVSLRNLIDNSSERETDLCVWLSLCDLFRATGDEVKFEQTALAFAAKFGRSAPQWGSTANDNAQRALSGKPVMPAGARFHWVCPSACDIQSIEVLCSVVARTPSPWYFDWRYVEGFEIEALRELLGLLRNWANEPIRIELVGHENLLQVLEFNSPANNRDINPLWWQVRLALLRLLGNMDEFETVALNYCVTYEMSPPAWEEPRNHFIGIKPQEVFSSDKKNVSSKKYSAELQVISNIDSDILRVKLIGEILGGFDSELISDDLSKIACFEFDCESLCRIDFGAASDLSNWVTEQKDNGRDVVFRHVNHLGAAFFSVIGITDVARVTLATN